VTFARQRSYTAVENSMSFQQEEREALRLLQAIENGSLPVAQIRQLVEAADPALVYLVCTWLRQRYGGDHPAAEGVIGRLVELADGPGGVNEKMKEGKGDPVSLWFEEDHEYRELAAEEFIRLVVDKLES